MMRNDVLSRSLRARGLKFDAGRLIILLPRSRSLRARGLKCNNHQDHLPSGSVALFTGAWIEIILKLRPSTYCQVALFTGAWIEMGIRMSYSHL